MSRDALKNSEKIVDLQTKIENHNSLFQVICKDLSHKLRGSVASILGICSVVDISNLSPENRELFLWILAKAKDLDHDIHELHAKIREAEDATNHFQ